MDGKIAYFEKITSDNKIFQKIFTHLLEEFAKIHKNFPDFTIRDLPVKKNSYYITSPDFIHQFIKLNNFDNKIELFTLLREILNFSKIKLEITISLDHSSLSLEIGDIYHNIIKNLFPYYFYHNSILNKQTLRLINEWRKCFSRKLLNLEIIIPLKGFYFLKDQFPDEDEIRFINQKNLDLSIKKIPEFEITSLERQLSNNHKYNIRHIASSKANYCISAKGQVPFYSFPSSEENIEFNFLWEHIKHLAETISLESTILRFGKPLYRLPWWISTKILKSFNFLVPDWMNQRYMNIRRRFMIIPDIYSISLPFSDSDEDEITNQNWVLPTRIFGFSQSQRSPEWELFGEGLKMEEIIEKSEPMEITTSYKISDPKTIRNFFQKLSKPSSRINFKKNNFILERLLKIGQRDHIEDAILDSCLILESIFLGKGNNTELSYRLKLYASSLLAVNLDQFEKEFEYFDMLYGIRSQIIHGTANWKKKAKGKSKYEKFIERCYPKLFPHLKIDKNFSLYRIDKLVQYELFKKIGEIIRIILERDIHFPSDFEKSGFFKIFLDIENQ